jgi:hypothetical protein
MKQSETLWAGMILIAAALACNIPGGSQPGVDVSLQATQIALNVQQTSMAIQQATAGAGQPVPVFTVQPPPATATAQPVATEVVPTEIDMDALIKASNILIYEDIVGDPAYVPIVGNTVSGMNFSGGRVINTGDALGDFRSQANSATRWDLMIVAGEDRNAFSGEMFEMMYDHIDNGGAVVIEIWYLNQVVNGKIAPILRECGVTLHRDWTRDWDFDPYKYSIYWLDTTHPLLSTPNVVEAPSYPYPVWFGDAGDLLEYGSGGDAVLVGGLYPNRKNDYGVLASCMGGRMVIQTFSSHDYKQDLIEALWENYITYTLTKHYEFED